MRSMKCFFCARQAALIGLSLFAVMLTAETLTYREVDGDLRTTHTLIITPAEPGYSVELQSRRDGGGIVRQTFRTAADLATVSWTFSDPERRMELSARVIGDAIVLSGSRRGEKVQEEFSAAGAPWNQLFQIGMKPFVRAGKKSHQFRSIGTQGPGELKMGKFTVTRGGEETVLLGGRQIAAVRLRISLSGLLSVFWHGDYWYRAGDGLFLRYRGKNRSGGPIAVSELVAEKRDES